MDPGEPGKDHATRIPNPDFVLNADRYRNAAILLARENFGCGSSREHAVWALLDDGFRVVIAPSFAEIFSDNCFKNGVLPIVLAADVVDRLFNEQEQAPGYALKVDLPGQVITTPAGDAIHFEVDAFRKDCLIRGLDDIGLTLEHAGEIRAFEEKHRQAAPWLFDKQSQE
jgi:3-isopropylmalate/(R)-2-methylmalate dehydratase small subunit